jgi:hypothetical protein
MYQTNSRSRRTKQPDQTIYNQKLQQSFLNKYSSISDIKHDEYFQLYNNIYPIVVNTLQAFGIPTGGFERLAPLLRNTFDQASNGLSTTSLQNIVNANGGIQNTLQTVVNAINDFISARYTRNQPSNEGIAMNFNTLRDTLMTAYNNAATLVNNMMSTTVNNISQTLQSPRQTTNSNLKSNRLYNLNSVMNSFTNPVMNQLNTIQQEFPRFISRLRGQFIDDNVRNIQRLLFPQNNFQFHNKTKNRYEFYSLTKNGTQLQIPQKSGSGSGSINIYDDVREILPGMFEFPADERLLDHPLVLENIGRGENMCVFDPLALFLYYGYIPFQVEEYCCGSNNKKKRYDEYEGYTTTYTNVGEIQSSKFIKTPLRSSQALVDMGQCDNNYINYAALKR